MQMNFEMNFIIIGKAPISSKINSETKNKSKTQI